MKHVFVIGSHTPYLTSLGVIEKLQIPSDDIIMVYGRNYKCSLVKKKYKSYDISDKYYIYAKGNNRNSFLKQIRWIDEFITNSINEEYVLYIPHLKFWTFQLFATHPLCCDIKFVQESITDFCRPKGTKAKLTLKSLYVTLRFTIGTRLWHAYGWNDYSGLGKVRVSETFAITDKMFRYMDECKHTLVKWPQIDTGLHLNKEATFFVFESAVERKDIEKDLYMKASKALISKYASELNYAKFHPYQTPENISLIKSFFKELNVTLQELPNDIPFELVMCTKEKYKICGFTTSLIYYAYLMGHEAHLCGPTLLVSTKFKSYWNRYTEQLKSFGDIFPYEKIELL